MPIKVKVHHLEGHRDQRPKYERCTITEADFSLTNVDNGTRTSGQVTTTVHKVVQNGEPAWLRSIDAQTQQSAVLI